MTPDPTTSRIFGGVRNNKGSALVITTVFTLLASLTAYLVMIHSSGVRSTSSLLVNSETSQIMLSVRNILVEDGIAVGNLRTPDPDDSLPYALMAANFKPPVTDVWGTRIKYCRYTILDQPVSGLAGRLISAGKNKKFQTLCSDEPGKGDDVVLDIFAHLINQQIIRSELSLGTPVILGADKASSYLLRSDGSFWVWGNNTNMCLQDSTAIHRRTPVRPRWSAGQYDFIQDINKMSASSASGFLIIEDDSSVWAAGVDYQPIKIPLNDVVEVQSSGFGLDPSNNPVAGEPTNGLALKNDGTVWAWGGNVPARKFLKAGIINNTAAVSASKTLLNGHGLGLKSDGTVWVWGRNESGQLGDGSTVSSIIPQQVESLTGVYTAVSAGSNYSLALKGDDGSVWAWGANNYGQLGDSSWTQRNSPVQVYGLTGVIAIAAGGSHSLALKSDGTVWAWGLNSNGQLGNGTLTNKQKPVIIPGLTAIAAISAGTTHSLALKTDQTVVAWGNNSNGQLGDGTTDQRLTPTAVAGLIEVTSIAAGASHSLALKADQTVVAWGNNDSGQLGDGTTVQKNSPAAVDVITGITAVSAGYSHSMAIKGSPTTVWAWGQNNLNNEIGDITSINRSVPVPVANLTGTVTGISAGGGNSFAITDNNLITWGNGFPSIFFPAQVWDAAGTAYLTGISHISAGLSHALALSASGAVWAWGADNYGQLGNDSLLTDSIYPVAVAGLAGVTAVSAGENHSLAVTPSGTVVGWGLNSNGQLGDTTTVQRPTPVAAAGPAGVTAISAGGSHSLALNGDKTVSAWGKNNVGQLGDNSTTERTSPIVIGTISNVTAIAAGGEHSLAITGDKEVWAWGENSSGQLGTGTWVSKIVPSKVLYVRYVVN